MKAEQAPFLGGSSRAASWAISTSLLDESIPFSKGPRSKQLVALDPLGNEPDRLSERKYSHADVWVTLAADLLSLVASMLLGFSLLAWFSSASSNSFSNLGSNLLSDFPFPLVCVFCFAIYGLYRQSRRRLRPSSFSELGSLLHALVAGSFGTIGVELLIHRISGRAEVSVGQLAATALTALLLVPAGRVIARRVWRDSEHTKVRLLVVGSGMMAERIRRYFSDEDGVELVGLVDDDPYPGTEVLGGIDDIQNLCEQLNIDRVLIGFSRTHPAKAVEKLRSLHGRVPISIVPRYFELLSWRSQVEEIYGLPVIDVAPQLLGLGARVTKRGFDIVGSSIGLLVAAPVLAVLAVAIKFSSPGPVLFRQERSGRDGRPFMILKLRTMNVDADKEKVELEDHNEVDGPLFKIREDPRVFPLGQFLRRSSLDELPQLFNVLKGHMSLVGPRPLIERESSQISGWAARRFEVRPGLTGLWQVSGRSELTYDELRQLDYLYVASWSLWWDLRILWHTPSRVMKGAGAF